MNKIWLIFLLKKLSLKKLKIKFKNLEKKIHVIIYNKTLNKIFTKNNIHNQLKN